MAILDTSKRPFIQDRDELIFIGIDLPFRKSDGVEGYFASTSFTIDAVKQNVIQLLETKKGERLFQPNLGVDLDRFLFEQITPETIVEIQNEIVESFNFWLPFVTIRDIQVTEGGNYDIGTNSINIYVEFSLNNDQRTLESVQVTIGE
jgi:phage baseplate assembly protein W|tara:strand:- start:5688 stop:6131 length:444 start_codon:yes stop_codon:yes gene_type:complete